MSTPTARRYRRCATRGPGVIMKLISVIEQVVDFIARHIGLICHPAPEATTAARAAGVEPTQERRSVWLGGDV